MQDLRRLFFSQGTSYFPIWFSELDENQDYKGNHENQTKIPDEPVEFLSQGELASPNALSKRIDDNQKDLNKRIELIEKEQTAKDYLIKTAVGLGVLILFKFAFDWFSYDNGFSKGVELKKKEFNI